MRTINICLLLSLVFAFQVQAQEDMEGSYSSAFTPLHSNRSSEENPSAAVERDPASDLQDPEDFSPPLVDLPVPGQQPPAAPSRGRARKAASESSAPAPKLDLDDELDKLGSSSAPSDMSASGETGTSAKDRKAMVLQTISRNYPELKRCYNEGLKTNANMKGKVVMGWAMDPQGRVLDVQVQTSQLNNKSVEKCMVERLSSWRFPRQAKMQGAKDRMTYTFQFIPE